MQESRRIEPRKHRRKLIQREALSLRKAVEAYNNKNTEEVFRSRDPEEESSWENQEQAFSGSITEESFKPERP
jgi:hypothetical protein